MLFLAGKKHLFIGFGGLASQSAACLLARGDQVVGVSRSAAKVVPGITHWLGDARSAAMLERIAAEHFDTVVITLSPDGRGPEAYRASYYDTSAALLGAWHNAARPPARIIFISSTSVYGQVDAEVVDEFSPTTPSADTAKILCETEALFFESPLPTTVLRFSGIYGPGRDYLLRQVRAGKGGSDDYTNRIHVDDCCGVICYLLQARGPLEPVYLASDKRPVKSRDIRRWLALQLGMNPNVLIESPSAGRGGNKRCCGKLLDAAGYTFIYPDYEAGYRETLDRFLR